MAIKFGVIFIDNNIDNFFNDRRKTKQQLIRSILKRKSEINFIRFIEATASYTGIDFLELPTTIEITGFLVFQDDRSVTHLTDDPSATFNLKNYLLVLAKKFDCSVYYCENINTQKIEWISTNHSDFGEILHEFSDITFSSTNTNELPQFLTDLKDKIIAFNFHEKIINNGLPFGIIFIVGDPIDIDDKNKKLEPCFHYYENSHFLYFPIITESYLILDNLKSYFIFQNENDKPFNLKQHLLELKKELGFEPSGIFYCENASTRKIELISNEPEGFKGVLLEFLQITSLSPNELPQFLANFKFSKSTYGIDKAEFSLSSLSLENMTPIDNLLSTLKCRIKNTLDRYSWHGYSKIPQEKRITQIKKQVSEECKVNPFFHSWRVSSEQNRKVNKIAEDLKNGKIVGKKIIDNVFDINASYCFITPEDLKNLKERLFIQKNIDITHVINQKKGEAFDHILINDIKYNLLDNTFHFIFNVDNSSQLTIKVPRKDLENYELPNTKKDIFNNLINIRRIDENLILKNNEEITNDLNPLLEQLKTQEFPLSDTITKAINQKEKGIVLDYALINDIKYNLLDNTFHFIFDVGNSLLKESSQLIIEVPREALDLENVDRLVENTLSPYETHSVYSESSLVYHLNKGSYIIDLHLIDD
ncbi:hypothetical protein EWZ98_04770 [Helicobacter pylori]|uniref:hypothetical protein n=1 Tax=Helicobacter pylori TaxID=210 RepID=UPI0013F42947|nr:hypothetical protein [Helicobacter pylori]NHA74270.1 hypothetical protein [Helicobacter pylori]